MNMLIDTFSGFELVYSQHSSRQDIGNPPTLHQMVKVLYFIAVQLLSLTASAASSP